MGGCDNLTDLDNRDSVRINPEMYLHWESGYLVHINAWNRLNSAFKQVIMGITSYSHLDILG